jgi:hypothetical protein
VVYWDPSDISPERDAAIEKRLMACAEIP